MGCTIPYIKNIVQIFIRLVRDKIMPVIHAVLIKLISVDEKYVPGSDIQAPYIRMVRYFPMTQKRLHRTRKSSAEYRSLELRQNILVLRKIFFKKIIQDIVHGCGSTIVFVELFPATGKKRIFHTANRTEGIVIWKALYGFSAFLQATKDCTPFFSRQIRYISPLHFRAFPYNTGVILRSLQSRKSVKFIKSRGFAIFVKTVTFPYNIPYSICYL